MAIQQIIVGTGGSVFPYPFPSYEQQGRMSMILLAADIGVSGDIQSLAFNFDTAPPVLINNLIVRVKHTSLFTWPLAEFENTGWTEVYSASNVNLSTGWYDFIFSAAFAYNGTDNLAVDVSFWNGFGAGPGFCFYTNAGANRSVFAEGNSGVDPLTWVPGPPPLPPISRMYEYANTRLTIDVPAPDPDYPTDFKKIVKQTFRVELSGSDPIVLNAENFQYSLNINGQQRLSTSVKGFEQAGEIATKLAGTPVLSLYEELVWLENGVETSWDFLVCSVAISNDNPVSTSRGSSSASIVINASDDLGSWTSTGGDLELEPLLVYATERELRDWNLATISSLLVPGQSVSFEGDSFVIGEVRGSVSDGGRQRQCFVREAESSIVIEDNPGGGGGGLGCSVDIGLLESTTMPYTTNDDLDMDRCLMQYNDYIAGGETCKLSLCINNEFNYSSDQAVRWTLDNFTGTLAISLYDSEYTEPVILPSALATTHGTAPINIAATCTAGAYTLIISDYSYGSCVARTNNFDLLIEEI